MDSNCYHYMKSSFGPQELGLAVDCVPSARYRVEIQIFDEWVNE